MQIQHTKVYRANVRLVRGIDKRRFARELQKARRFGGSSTSFTHASRHLHNAFLWSCTPQGFAFWYDLCVGALG